MSTVVETRLKKDRRIHVKQSRVLISQRLGVCMNLLLLLASNEQKARQMRGRNGRPWESTLHSEIYWPSVAPQFDIFGWWTL